MVWVRKADLKSGQVGPQGPEGPPGQPGTNGVATDTAIASNISSTADTATKTALNDFLVGREKVRFGPLDTLSGWKMPFTDESDNIAFGVRTDDTFVAPGVAYVGTAAPPDPPLGMWGVWLRPNTDGTLSVLIQQGA